MQHRCLQKSICKIVERMISDLLDIEDIICCLRDKFLEQGLATSYENINEGLCDEFAACVCTFLPGCTMYWNDDFTDEFDCSHCFIEYEDRYYDAECPEGVDDWRDLPFFQRCAEGVY